MKIEEIKPDSTATLVATIGAEKIEFDTILRDAVPKKHLITADPIYRNEKIISFRAKGLVVDLVTQPEGSAPIVFKNVAITLMKREDGSICYAINTIAESKVLNRRNSFRCYVGVSTTVQAGGNKAAHDAIIKDVSMTGFAVTCSADTDFHENQVLHVVLNDYLEELAENFNFHLYGLIVRIEQLDNGSVIYGCKMNSRVAGIDAYIMKKERLRMKKQKGT